MPSTSAQWDRLLAIWNGEASLDDLDELVTADYVGHIGSRARDLPLLKRDILSYRGEWPGVVFRIEHQFGEGELVATRLTATRPSDPEETICGMNISRWRDGRLAEEWAVWERFSGG